MASTKTPVQMVLWTLLELQDLWYRFRQWGLSPHAPADLHMQRLLQRADLADKRRALLR